MSQPQPAKGILLPGMVTGATRRNLVVLLVYLFVFFLGVSLVLAVL